MIERWLALQQEILGPTYEEATIALIDALRDFIKTDMEIANDIFREGGMTEKEVKAMQERGREYMLPFRQMLADLETYRLDPTLNGVCPIPDEWK
jgi:hypothetical protein